MAIFSSYGTKSEYRFLTAALVSLLFSYFSVRRSHSEREDLQAVYKEAARGRETEDPPGQRTQVHVNFPPTTHLLFSLQRVYLVRKSNHCRPHASVSTVSWI